MNYRVPRHVVEQSTDALRMAKESDPRIVGGGVERTWWRGVPLEEGEGA